MTEIEIRDASYAFFTIGQSDTDNTDESVDKAETVEDSGGRRKLTHVVKDKHGKSPRKSKGKPMLARQDTFVLEEETPPPSLSPRHLGLDHPSVLRAKSSYGIKSILERAEGISSLSPQVKEYLSAHMRMMGEENSKLMIENNRLQEEIVVVGEEWEKKIKSVNQTLEKEKAKNKMLMIRLKENDKNGMGGGIIWADDNMKENKRQRSASQGSRTASKSSRSRSNSSVSMASIASLMSVSSSMNSSNRAGTPAPLVGGEEGKINLLSKKIRVYRTQVQTLRNELDRVKAVLGEEVGKEQVEALLAGEKVGWQGRAQMVTSLQQTVETLQGLLMEKQRGRGGTDSVLSEHYFADSEHEEGGGKEEKEEKKTKEKKIGKLLSVAGSSDSEGSKGSSLSLNFGSSDNSSKEGSEVVQMKKLSREYRMISHAAEAERGRLSELVQMLTARLKIAEERTSEAESSLREERTRSAHAERALERANLELREKGRLGARSAGGRQLSGSWRVEVEDLEDMAEEELRWEIIRLREEMRALRRELGEARGAREEMVRIYTKMLEESRMAFRQNLES